MSYIALYRKFRPHTFADVKGQDHIVSTLKNQIEAGRIGHAYLFCGTRGTGKTSVAKILAKAVNCEQPVEGSPCGVCDTCKGIASGSLLNVVEIDAASNNGVDNIRGIREEVEYRPPQGKYKVYIIDEVHMLSIGAFNALLKTLEEPPEYVVFILATTEVHKIPVTILSRCQRYDFKRISIDTIAGRLTDLMAAEKNEAEEKAIRYIARAADGSMRDALSLLDQCIAFYLGECLKYDQVLQVLGAVDTDMFSKLLRGLLARDVTKVLVLLEEMISKGRELAQLASDFTWYLRNLLLLKSSDNMEEVLDVSRENLVQLTEEAQMIESDMLIRFIRIFSELSGQLKYATQKRVLMEVTLIKLCRPQMESNQDTLLERIRSLEEKISEGVHFAGAPEKAVYESGEKSVLKKAAPPKLPKAIHEDVKAVAKDFRAIARTIPGMLGNYLKQARLSVGDRDQLMIVMPDEIGYGVITREGHEDEIKTAIAAKIGKTVEIEVRQVEQGRKFEDSFVDLEQLIQMEITVED